MDSDLPSLQIPGREIEGGIQLSNVYLYEVKVAREATALGEAGQSSRLDPKIRGWSVDEERHSMIVVLGATVHHQFRPEATVDVDISVAGHFSSGTPIDEDAARSFSTVNGLLLLWPYLRGYVGSLAASMQLDLPTLPVIDAAELIRRVENQTRMREVAANADHDGNAIRT